VLVAGGQQDRERVGREARDQIVRRRAFALLDRRVVRASVEWITITWQPRTALEAAQIT